MIPIYCCGVKIGEGATIDVDGRSVTINGLDFKALAAVDEPTATALQQHLGDFEARLELVIPSTRSGAPLSGREYLNIEFAPLSE